MLEFKVVHKYCRCVRTIQGHDVWSALKNNNLDYNVWIVESVSRV